MTQNNSSFTPTSESALLAQKSGQLSEWVQELLHSEGSTDLAKSLAEEKIIAIEIYDFPLTKLKKIQGPEENVSDRQSPHVWEESVSAISRKILEGYKPAPLIVTDFWNYFEIADGNHRQEALLRAGKTHYWTIFFIKHQKGKEYLETLIKS